MGTCGGAGGDLDEFIDGQLGLLDELDHGEKKLAFLLEEWRKGLTVRAVGNLVRAWWRLLS